MRAGLCRRSRNSAATREPDRMNTEAISREEIAAIWQAYGLGAVRALSIPRRGCSNACFLVNQDRVIRFQVKDLHRRKFRAEQLAYDLLRAGEIPVPELLVLDESQTLVPHAFMITTRLPGETVFESWSALDERTRQQIAFEAGRCLALLHRHPLPAFGSLSRLAEGGFPTWTAYLEDYVARYGRQARDEKLLDAATTTRIEQLLVQFQPLLAAVTPGRLLHGDYQFENVLQQDGQVTGIIDFEWAMSGDPAFDCRLDESLAECPGSVEPFYAGYESVSPFPDHHRLKADFYRLLLCLEDIAGWGRDPDAASWMPGEYRRLDELLPALEREG